MSNKLLAASLMVLLAIPAVLVAGPAVGSPAPNFSLADTAGISHTLASYRGRVVQLQFWDSG